MQIGSIAKYDVEFLKEPFFRLVLAHQLHNFARLAGLEYRRQYKLRSRIATKWLADPKRIVYQISSDKRIKWGL